MGFREHEEDEGDLECKEDAVADVVFPSWWGKGIVCHLWM